MSFAGFWLFLIWRLLELIEKDEKRVCERAAMLQAEKMAADALRHEEPLPYSEAYLKSIKEPSCDGDGNVANNEVKHLTFRPCPLQPGI